MLFSIIVPVHNGKKYIRSSVESVINQTTDQDYEIIIVENGSTDGTAEIVDELIRDNDKVIGAHLGPIGLYMARQMGIGMAKGSYIISLDSDDEADPALIDTLYQAITAYKAKGQRPDIIYYNVADMDNRDKPLFNHPLESGKLYIGSEKRPFYELLCQGDSINSMWSKCVARDVAYLGTEGEYLNYGEDLYQTVQFLDRAQSVLFLDKILYYYRQNDVSITSTYSEVFISNQKIVWDMVDKTVRHWDIPEADELLSRRKSLTCAIEVSKIVEADMSHKLKKVKLSALLSDEFYQKYHAVPLPDWAPEQSIFYHDIMCRDDALEVLSKSAFKFNLKTKVKKLAGK